jgi:hypothetical protein
VPALTAEFGAKCQVSRGLVVHSNPMRCRPGLHDACPSSRHRWLRSWLRRSPILTPDGPLPAVQGQCVHSG